MLLISACYLFKRHLSTDNQSDSKLSTMTKTKELSKDIRDKIRRTQGWIRQQHSQVQVQITLFVPSGAIRCATGNIIQITHNTEIAYLAGMAKILLFYL